VRLLVLPSGKAAMGFAGKFWVGMSRQFNSTNHRVASFSMIGDKCGALKATRVAEHAGIHTQRR
jgi:hypothetical protein